MARASFRFLDSKQAETILPQMFDILFTNMNNIAPTGNSYDEDKAMWLSFMFSSVNKGPQQILLMYSDEELVGYFQYSIDGNTLFAEEIEIRPDYQRTFLFTLFFRYLMSIMPKNIEYIKANIHKDNLNSQTIAGKLGMQIVGENKNKISWHLIGPVDKFKK